MLLKRYESTEELCKDVSVRQEYLVVCVDIMDRLLLSSSIMQIK